MLVLSRKIGDRIVVSLGGETVTIEVLKISGNRVRVGVDALASISVQRHEIWERMGATDEHRACPIPAACPKIR